MIITLLLVAVLHSGPLPDLSLTPGAVRPLSRTEVCTTRWSLDRRHVTQKMKRTVAAAYGVPWADSAQYEFDHLIPRELGGADSVLNLWPQPWVYAKQKDRVENRLHVLVCTGLLSLDAARAAILANWTTALEGR